MEGQKGRSMNGNLLLACRSKKKAYGKQTVFVLYL